jgi:hypothetical protein
VNAKFLLILFTVCFIPVAGQTAAEIEQAYGKPMLAYSVTEHIWMTPDFAADGQVCRMRFYPKRVGDGSAYVQGNLTIAELKWILNQIVPPSSRGAKKDGFGLGDIGGGIADTHFDYEKVSFNFLSAFDTHLMAENLKKADRETSVLLDDPFDLITLPPPPPPPSESDFDNSVGTEIVTLSWNDRKCAKYDDEVAPNFKSVAEIEQRFGAPEKTYSVGQFISMTPAFGADGQVCQMWLYPKRVSETTNYLGTKLQFDDMRRFLNRLVPPEQRGLKQTVNVGTTATGGHMAWTTYPYERVGFTFYAGSRSSNTTTVEPILRRGEFTFSIPYTPEPIVKDLSPSINDFRPADDAEIVIVHWELRTCVN